MDVLHGLTSEFAHGRAFSEVVAGDSPVAGANYTYTVSSRYWERLASVAFRLVTDGNAANRIVTLAVNAGDGVLLAAIPSQNVQIASLTRDYVYLPNVSQAIGPVGGIYTAPLAPIFLQPGFTLTITITSVQATDALSRIRLYVERFDTGPDGLPVGMVTEAPLVSRVERLGD